MSYQSLQAGEVVMLNSGGPRMTVVCVDELGIADTTWMDEMQVFTGKFSNEALTIVEPLVIPYREERVLSKGQLGS